MIAAGIYRVMMRYTSIKDLIGIIRGAAYGAALLVAAVVFTYGLKGYPRSVSSSTRSSRSARSAARACCGCTARRASPRGEGESRSVLIVGAGDAADDLIRELRRTRAPPTGSSASSTTRPEARAAHPRSGGDRRGQRDPEAGESATAERS